MSGDSPLTFIVSLDCEGKWGMADCLDAHHDRTLTTPRLAKAYEKLVQLFGRYDIDATFAFVMAFLLQNEELERFNGILLGDLEEEDEWLARYRQARLTGTLEGWHLPEALEIVRSVGHHEIACHGFSHRPLAQDAISAGDVGEELAAASDVAAMRQIELSTFIFPRNQVGHLEQVRSAGYLGYRTALAGVKGFAGRLTRTAEELNIWRGPQQEVPCRNGLVPIPAGFFFNWRYGARKAIPPKVTQLRWRNLLRRGSYEGGVVHLWLHPHNLITAPDVSDTLERVLAEVAEFRSARSLRVMTQHQYCREVLSAALV